MRRRWWLVALFAVFLIVILLILNSLGALSFVTSVPAKWVRKVGSRGANRIDAPVTVDHDQIYVAAMDFAPGLYPWGEVHYIQALDASTGNFRWHCEVEGTRGLKPVYQDGVIYLMARRGRLYALDAASGQLKWTFPGVTEEGSLPVVGGGNVYLEIPGHAIALSAQTGKVLWMKTISNAMTPMVTRETAYVVDDGTLYALDPLTGGEKWKYGTDRWIATSPVASGGVIYLGLSIPADGQDLVALDAYTGAELWRLALKEKGEIDSVSISNGTAYIGMYVLSGPEAPVDGYIVAVDLATQKEKWRYTTDSSVSDLLIADNVIYFAASNQLRAVAAIAGNELWHYTAGNTLYAPALANGVLYASDWRGYLHAVPLPASAQR